MIHPVRYIINNILNLDCMQPVFGDKRDIAQIT